MKSNESGVRVDASRLHVTVQVDDDDDSDDYRLGWLQHRGLRCIEPQVHVSDFILLLYIFYLTNVSLQVIYTTTTGPNQQWSWRTTTTTQGLETHRASAVCKFYYLHFTLLTTIYRLSTQRQWENDQTSYDDGWRRTGQQQQVTTKMTNGNSDTDDGWWRTGIRCP